MSKKKIKEQEEKQEISIEDELAQEMKLQDELENLQQENLKLKKQLKEKDEISQNIQVQYLSIKNEFDAFSKRVQQNEQKTKDEIFEKLILKILPILELFNLSYEHLPTEIAQHKRTEWLNIINKKISDFLNDSHVEIIPTVWEMPDEDIHELIWTQPTQDENQKWKIVTEVKKWYLLKYAERQKTLIPAKVLIWE